MRLALHQLGIYQCYHMLSVLSDLNKAPDMWIRAFDAKYGGKGKWPWSRAEWDKILGLSQACCDSPAVHFSVDIANVYPEAKVVILNRDAEAWYESVQSTISNAMKPKTAWGMITTLYMAALDSQQRNWMRLGMTMGKYLVPLDDPKKKAETIAWFHSQHKAFREGIPEERRIEFSVKDGWKPLCDHLGLPVPLIFDEESGEMIEAPFPYVNDRETWLKNFKRMRGNMMAGCHRTLFFNVLCPLAAVILLGCLIWKAV